MTYLASGADISADGRHRYLLWREWRTPNSGAHWRWFGARDGNGARLGEPKSCLFIMLNPSTADADLDDPTIRRCVGFAKRENYDRAEVVNLFAYRATDPRALLALNHDDDPVGERNHDVIERAAERAGLIVCGWGAHGGHLGQDETVRGWLIDYKLYSLGCTKAGHPKHPLYLKADSALVELSHRMNTQPASRTEAYAHA